MFKLVFSNSLPQRKDMTNMSFVGIHNTKEGLIAFADSKSSRVLNTQQIVEDENRGKICKVFKNSNFIFVTHGNNELFSGYKKVNIEDYIKRNLTEDIHYKDFFAELFSLLLLYKPEYNNGIYNFIIGSKDSKGYYIRELKLDISKCAPEYSNKIYEYKSLYGGDKKYVNIYDILPKYFDAPIQEYSNIVKKQIEHLIGIFDEDYKYNSVGLPVTIKIFK